MYKSKLENGFKFYGCDISSDYLDKFLKKIYLDFKISKIKFKNYKKELINQSGGKVYKVLSPKLKKFNSLEKKSNKKETTFKKVKFFEIFSKKNLRKFNILK